MKARVFTSAGINAFEEFLEQAREDPSKHSTEELVKDPELSVEFEHRIELPVITAETSRFHWGNAALSLLDGREPASGQRQGFWSWLSAYYFDVLCPWTAQGHRVGHSARHIPSSDFRTYYRHLLLAPWYVCRAHSDNTRRALAVLASPLHAPGDVAEQVIARQELVLCAPFMEALTKLYVDSETSLLKRGAAASGSSRTGGHVRRFITFTNQLRLTYDLSSLSSERLVDLLPDREYARFKRA